jgi:hypothetical protein
MDVTSTEVTTVSLLFASPAPRFLIKSQSLSADGELDRNRIRNAHFVHGRELDDGRKFDDSRGDDGSYFSPITRSLC